jgi:hypothetical protein
MSSSRLVSAEEDRRGLRAKCGGWVWFVLRFSLVNLLLLVKLGIGC